MIPLCPIVTKEESTCAHAHECVNIPSSKECFHCQIFLRRESEDLTEDLISRSLPDMSIELERGYTFPKHQCSTELGLSASLVAWEAHGRVLVAEPVVGSCAGRGRQLPRASHCWAQPPLEPVTATHARQVSRRYPSTPAPTYLWKTCSHQGEEDARGDRLLEASGWGDSWRCAAEGAAVETQPEALFDRRCPCQRELFIGDVSPQASHAKEGRPLRDYSPLGTPHRGGTHRRDWSQPTPDRDTKNEAEAKGKQQGVSDRTHYVLDSNPLRCPSPHQDREGLSITCSENKGKSD